MTLATLRTLLERARGPGVERLTDRSIEGIARAYLPFVVYCLPSFAGSAVTLWLGSRHDSSKREWEGRTLNLLDGGLIRALPALLALAHGLDPGPMGLEVSFTRIDEMVQVEEDRYTVRGWFLYTADGGRLHADDDEDPSVCAIATEPDPIKALVMACELAAQ